MKKYKKRNHRNISKMLIFGQAYIKFDGFHSNVKTDKHAIDISTFPQTMKEQLLKVSAP